MTLRPRLRPGRFAARGATATLIAIAIVAIAGRWIAPYDAALPGDAATERLLPPSAHHLLGTDAIARDVLSRLMAGTSVSIGTAVLALGIVVALGMAWGGVAGMAGARTDRWMMRIVDALLATPRLLVLLALVAFTGRVSPVTLAVLIGLTSWPPMSRIVRARVREIAATDYVAAARAVGAPPARILVHHVLPGTVPAVLAAAVMALAAIVPLEAALTFLGVGIAPPTPSWGAVLHDARDRTLDAWWLLAFPSLAIAATVLSVNVLGERLQHRASGDTQ
ncbi:MAG: ABC transporter permease [Gemmatimonadaceae bacterium]|nr:ABC transporter permease [Gemmatimonadaceae bacterium]